MVGFEVVPSKNHPEPDICDDLKGRYPKTFDFSGWHPHCRCHTEPIMKTVEEMERDNAAILAGGEPSAVSVNTVGGVPSGFLEWVKLNGAKIGAAKSLPYFVRDNRKLVDGILNPAPSALEVAKERHAARTPEQVQEIRKQWVLHEAAVRHAQRTLEQSAAIRKAWNDRKKRLAAVKTLAESKETTTLPKIIAPASVNDTPQKGHIYLGDVEASKERSERVSMIESSLGVSNDEASAYFDAVNGYSGDYYSEIRNIQSGRPIEKLRKGLTLEQISKKAQDLENFISKSPQWVGGTTYRGMSMSPKEIEFLRNQLKEGEGDMLGSSSWSTAKSQAKTYSKTCIGAESRRFGDKKESKVILVSESHKKATSIRHLSEFPIEDEVLASMACRYVYEREEEKNGYLYFFVKAK